MSATKSSPSLTTSVMPSSGAAATTTKTTATTASAANTANAARRRGRPANSSGRGVRPSASLEAKRRAAVILDVLGGVRLPSEAAAMLGVSVPRYYLLEQQALCGLLAACEPRTLCGPRIETRLAQLEKQLRERERECARQQALVRAAQRTVGLASPAARPASTGKTAPNTAKSGKSRRRRRPTVRALKAAGQLRANSSGLLPAEGLQPSAMGLASGGESSAAQPKEA